MIYSIIRIYLPILLIIGISSILIFLFGVLLLFRKKFAFAKKPEKSATIISFDAIPALKDLAAIAGDDSLSTQLDLARAYIEAGKESLAKNILNTVISQGSTKEQSEARELLLLIKC